MLTICPDSEVTINGTIYNANNSSGVEILAAASTNGRLYRINGDVLLTR